MIRKKLPKSNSKTNIGAMASYFGWNLVSYYEDVG